MLKNSTRFTQQKFNLLKEESEGFSKLIDLLINVPITKPHPQRLKDLVNCLLGFYLFSQFFFFILMWEKKGQFDLDPNRVFDMVLSAMECNLSNFDLYISLLEDVPSDTLANLLGFKFQFFNVFIFIFLFLNILFITKYFG